MKTRSSTSVTPRSHFSARTVLLILGSSMPAHGLCPAASFIDRRRLGLNCEGVILDGLRGAAAGNAKGRARRPALPFRLILRSG